MDVDSSASVHQQAKEAMDENNGRQDSLAGAKDRAQLTAATAMSVVHVTLLKATIDAEPKDKKYYMASLVLISVCLCIQVLVGLLTIYITHLHNYYKKFADDVCSETAANLCCCKIVSESLRNLRLKRHQRSISRKGLAMKWAREPDSIVEMQEILSEEAGDRYHNEFRCCCCWLSKNTYDEYEFEILDLYEHWLEKMAQVELEAVTADEEIRFLSEQVIRAKEKLNQLEEDQSRTSTTPKEFENVVKDVRNQLDEAEKTKQWLMKRKRRFFMMEQQGEVLARYANAVKKRRVLKRVTFWQDIINYLLYIVFIMNAFIAGLGLVGNSRAPDVNRNLVNDSTSGNA